VAHLIVAGESLSAAMKFGPYDLILESVGASSLGSALAMLACSGVCFRYGVSGSNETAFDVRGFFATGGGILYGFILFHEMIARFARGGFTRLAAMVAAGTLHPQIELEAPWTEIASAASKFHGPSIPGKSLLHL
jgi:NADPH2:quinone reductase